MLVYRVAKHNFSHDISGDQWLKSQATLLLKVPSAVVPQNVGWNIMVNPMHPSFAASCKILSIVDWNVDFRLKQ